MHIVPVRQRLLELGRVEAIVVNRNLYQIEVDRCKHSQEATAKVESDQSLRHPTRCSIDKRVHGRLH